MSDAVPQKIVLSILKSLNTIIARHHVLLILGELSTSWPFNEKHQSQKSAVDTGAGSKTQFYLGQEGIIPPETLPPKNTTKKME